MNTNDTTRKNATLLLALCGSLGLSLSCAAQDATVTPGIEPPAAPSVAAPSVAAPTVAAPAAPAPTVYSSELSTGIVVYVDKIKRSGGGSVVVSGRIANPYNEDYSFSSIKDYSQIQVRLQDLDGKKQYESVRAAGFIVGSRHDYSKIVSKGSVKFWTRVTAPPESVERVTVVFEGDGAPIDNVPIEK